MTHPPTVEQRHRDAAASLMRLYWSHDDTRQALADDIERGCCEQSAFVQALARPDRDAGEAETVASQGER